MLTENIELLSYSVRSFQRKYIVFIIITSINSQKNHILFYVLFVNVVSVSLYLQLLVHNIGCPRLTFRLL